MKLNHTRAAKVLDMSRSTLYAHVKKGKVSQEQDSEGNPVYDISELMRAYPDKDINATTLEQSSGVAVEQHKTPPQYKQLDLEVEVLKQERDHLKELLTIERERREKAEEEKADFLEIIKTQTRQLEAPKEPEPIRAAGEVATQPEQVHKKGFWQRMWGA